MEDPLNLQTKAGIAVPAFFEAARHVGFRPEAPAGSHSLAAIVEAGAGVKDIIANHALAGTHLVSDDQRIGFENLFQRIQRAMLDQLGLTKEDLE